ncbi:hypothetical protein GCM10010988_41540 [Cnuibacter physcomitrellae]|uniref:DUF3846 domain-containing protein n=1 Tax=Cnuibacter physcomitrellae TaxID=1619308 RepID=A0A1X9LRR1_9MICO|nr:DUF3846 domain-containing protein [Cnuibacter physcomitrellae]ARJ07797.1 hypothetical protein B5808_20620 [Cnuibacter physcomitrellae]GGI42938.1 hypothetical protein GCM10010988_41540 [Cnuibacter physcomitrellae]
MTSYLGVKIDAEGSIHIVEFAAEDVHDRLAALYRLIGCDVVETVDVHHGVTVWVDEEGLYRQDPNPMLTAVVRQSVPQQTPIHGAGVFLASTEDGDIASLSQDQALAVVQWWLHSSPTADLAAASFV